MPKSPKPDPTNALIVVNPVAGKQSHADKVKVIQSIARKHGWKGKIAETTKDLGADEIISQALKQGTRHFVICGGDGSVAQAAGALAQKQAVLGVMPGGTANLFVHNLDLPIGIEESLKTALLGAPYPVDIGVANGVHFTVIAGLGLDAQIIKGANRKLKNQFGMMAYFGAAIKNMPRKPAKFSIKVDDHHHHQYKAKSIMVANLGKIVGGLEVVPKTGSQTGTLEVGVLHPSGIRSWISIFIQGIQGHVQRSEHYALLEGKHIEIKCLGEPQAFECDGSSKSTVSELSIDMLPQSLWVMRP